MKTYEIKGTVWEMTQEAYLDGNEYVAHIKEIDGYREGSLHWKIKEGIDINTLQDESEACDWENPSWIEIEGEWEELK